MLIQGDYVKIKNKKDYTGKIGIIKGYDGYMYYEIRLLDIKMTISCLEDQIEKIREEDIKNRYIRYKFKNNNEIELKDQDLRITCNCLSLNAFFKGLFALGRYYSDKNYPDEFKNDYFTQKIINIKNHNRNAAKDIAEILLFFIKKSEILTNIVKKIDIIVMMPSTNYINHVKQWGDIICVDLNKRDLSEFIYISPEKEDDLRYYKYKKAWQRSKIIEGAFKIKDPHKSSFKGKSCLILDDICTTGNQINELTNTLAEVSVKEVYAFVIGKTKS